jgi:hypothetical protein
MIRHDWSVLRRSGWPALAGIAFATVGCVAANAQNAQSPVTMSTNAKGVGIVVPPPPGFNAAAASKSERALYAVPPEPDQTLAPYMHAMWQRYGRADEPSNPDGGY